MRSPRFPLGALLVGLSLALATPAPAQPAPPSVGRPAVAIPEPLRPWVGWVLAGHEEKLCPFLHGEDGEPPCAWPSTLALTLTDGKGLFSQTWRTWIRGTVPLPGDAKVWPQSVRVGGRPATVVDGGEGPALLLPPGEHTITGEFLWDEVPESLAVPAATGLLSLSLRGAKVVLPGRDERGRLWLQKGATKLEADVLELTVGRLVTDEVPLTVTTRIELRAAGKSREALLGKVLPPGFVAMSLDSPLPARLDPDGRLRVQVRPGTFTLTLLARAEGKVAALTRPAPDGDWAESEVWAFASRPSLRTVTLEGAPPIDPQQTSLPEEWKRLPCHLLRAGDSLRLVEVRRGDSDPAPDQLELSRELWLDFDGGGFTARDRLSGSLRRQWRLEVDPPTELGRVAVGGVDQVVTKGAAGEGRVGVEVRQGQVQVEAVSRIPRHGAIPAVSWASDFHKVAGELHLPPGWTLAHATGVDEIQGTWVRRWTLLDFFLLLIVSFALGRLYGARLGAVALLTLILTFPEEEAPRWSLVLLLTVEALHRVLPAGRLQWVARWLRLGLRVTLVLVAALFAMQHVRHRLYPALERDGGDDSMFEVAERFTSLKAEPAAQMAPSSPAAEEDGRAQGLEGGVGPGGGGGGEGSGEATINNALQRDVAGKLGRKERPKIEQQQQQADVQKSYLAQIDPNAQVQTGPGVPRWSWQSFPLVYSGPVEHGQKLHLFLISPPVNLLLAILRVLLLLAVVLILVGLPERFIPGPLRLQRAVAGMVLLAGLFASSTARGELPPQAVLDELQKRLLAPPDCHPRCASISRLSVEALPELCRGRMEILAAASTAVPLPGTASQWLPERVILDGKPAPALRRSDDGKLWLALGEGSHEVLFEGPLPLRDAIQIALPLKPHRVEAKGDGWRVDGLHENGQVDEVLQLSRVARVTPGSGETPQPGALPPFVRVERVLRLGLQWEVETRVLRATPTGSAVVLEVPLLPGESVVTADVRVEGGKALVNLSPAAGEASWRSILKQRSPLVLTAPATTSWVEVWRLDASPIWHVALSGIPVIHGDDGRGLRRPEWRPFAGEEVRLEVTRPEAVEGSTLTIDRSRLTVRPGLRSTEATLVVTIRSSRGAPHTLTLPEGALLQSVSVDGTVQPIRQEGRKVTVPLQGREQLLELTFRESRSIAFLYRTSGVDLGAPSANHELILSLAHDRWTLFVWGPRLGPAVLFWSFVLVLLLLSFTLGKIRWTPLRFHHFLLLGLGLSQVPVAAAAIVVGWLLALGYRRDHAELANRHLFNLRQVLLGCWTVAAFVVLIASIREGLLGEPDMQIAGNGSHGGELRWFQDRTDSVPPGAFAISLPLWSYRVAMLLWALWLAPSLLRWLRWGWSAFGEAGLWRRQPPKGPAQEPPKGPPPPPIQTPSAEAKESIVEPPPEPPAP